MSEKMTFEKAREIVADPLTNNPYLHGEAIHCKRCKAKGFLAGHASRDPEVEKIIADKDFAYRQMETALDDRDDVLEKLVAECETVEKLKAEYQELVDALCSKSWLPRDNHKSVIELAKKMKSRELEIKPL